ncbi:hypothetical protein [Breoghania sp.]|uniref:hypothetical protein n=1 Tax=Breoghania sp. TaxID=2065378 RepID=UPI0029CA9F45|nr:hypothetical protein [Breoghania sp.]
MAEGAFRIMARFGTFAATVGILLSTIQLAGAGEVHIISRDRSGAFVSSHQIFSHKPPAQRVVPVDYCGRTYYVYRSTLNWLESQAYEGRLIGVEYSNGKNWRLICRKPEEQTANVPPETGNKKQTGAQIPKSKKYGWINMLNKRAAN